MLHLPRLDPRAARLRRHRGDGTQLRVVGMQSRPVRLWRRRQAHAILATSPGGERPLPSVLMGDLNEWSTRACLRDFPPTTISRVRPQLHARRPIAQLDRIMVSPELAIVASGGPRARTATARRASDHLPVGPS